MKPIRFFAMLLSLALLCGCQAQLNREYSSIRRHEEQFEVDQHSDALIAENYVGLKNAILSLVESGTDYGVLRIYSYDGNIVSDLANAVYEVCHNDPLGAFAVDYMTYDYAHIVSYYEIYIYTTFRVPITSIDSIIRCSGTFAVETELETALLERKYQLALRISNYNEFDPAAIIHRLYMEHPELGISEPEIFWTLYPESGVQRILEISIIYPNDAMSMRSRQNKLAETKDDMAALLSVYPNDLQKIQRLYSWFVDHVTYMDDDSALFASAYNALVKEYCNCLGLSLAAQLMCDTLDIPSFIVEGRKDDIPWYWNIIYIDDTWQHMDISQALIVGDHKFQPLFDEDMGIYQWDKAAYPACPAPTEEQPDESEQNTPIEDDIPEPEESAPNLIPYPNPDEDEELGINVPTEESTTEENENGTN